MSKQCEALRRSLSAHPHGYKWWLAWYGISSLANLLMHSRGEVFKGIWTSTGFTEAFTSVKAWEKVQEHSPIGNYWKRIQICLVDLLKIVLSFVIGRQHEIDCQAHGQIMHKNIAGKTMRQILYHLRSNQQESGMQKSVHYKNSLQQDCKL